jgi:hypothetical protein
VARTPNPFKPTAGSNPPLLVGRQNIVDEFAESIEDGPGAPGRITIFTGTRGVGKTVMLNAVSQRAEEDYQWLVVHDTAVSGLPDRLAKTLARLATEVGTTGLARHRVVMGVTLPGIGGVTLAPPTPGPPPDLREAAGALVSRLEANGTGLLITVDEIHSGARDDLSHLSAAVQHLIRENREVAIVMAGLPAAVSSLLSAEPTTFLRRANRFVLEDVPLADVRQAFADTIEAHGRTISPGALDQATAATGGYPFMIQLVGYHIWRKAEGDRIDERATAAGIPAAQTRLGALVHGPALHDLTPVDRTFLLAMARDDGPSWTAEVARRMGKSTSYTSVYRNRLIEAGIIESVQQGVIDFAIPYLREYIREHAAHLELSARTV